MFLSLKSSETQKTEVNDKKNIIMVLSLISVLICVGVVYLFGNLNKLYKNDAFEFIVAVSIFYLPGFIFSALILAGIKYKGMVINNKKAIFFVLFGAAIYLCLTHSMEIFEYFPNVFSQYKLVYMGGIGSFSFFLLLKMHLKIHLTKKILALSIYTGAFAAIPFYLVKGHDIFFSFAIIIAPWQLITGITINYVIEKWKAESSSASYKI